MGYGKTLDVLSMTQEPATTYITWRKDGEKFKGLCQKHGILKKVDQLSTLFNTDGIAICKSSKVGVWPLFMVINELPPEVM